MGGGDLGLAHGVSGARCMGGIRGWVDSVFQYSLVGLLMSGLLGSGAGIRTIHISHVLLVCQSQPCAGQDRSEERPAALLRLWRCIPLAQDEGREGLHSQLGRGPPVQAALD